MPLTDRIRLADRSFALVRVDGPPLFDPLDYEIVVASGSEWCPRGWYGEWTLDKQLTLRALHVRVPEGTPLPLVEGVAPVRAHRRTRQLVGHRWVEGRWPSWDHVYRGLTIERAFTGSLWLGADPVPDVVADPLLRYRDVWDVFVEDGRVRAALDRSTEAAGARFAKRPSSATFDTAH